MIPSCEDYASQFSSYLDSVKENTAFICKMQKLSDTAFWANFNGLLTSDDDVDFKSIYHYCCYKQSENDPDSILRCIESNSPKEYPKPRRMIILDKLLFILSQLEFKLRSLQEAIYNASSSFEWSRYL